jgi:hypothetical protein
VVGLRNVLQVVQGKAQAALTDSAATDSSAIDSAVTDSTAEWTDTATSSHIGTVHTQLKVALICG